MDSVSNAAARLTPLYQPMPASHLQSNLANYYERTSQFVNEQFKQLVEAREEGHILPKSKKEDTRESSPRIKPKGLGNYLDIYV